MQFDQERADRIRRNRTDGDLLESSTHFMRSSIAAQYSYNFSWLGRPIIQYPQDMIAVQEIIWTVRPDLIIETGIAHGGSLIMSASMLALLDYCDAVTSRSTLDPQRPARKVLGVDIDIRPHNRAAIEAHPMSNRIEMIQGSAVAPDVVAQVQQRASSAKRVLVCLDSNHTHEHVLKELEAYAPLVSLNSYCIVFDTVVEDLPQDLIVNRPWGQGDNPKTAVHQFITNNEQFVIDQDIDAQLLISVAPHGYLKRVRI